MSAMYRAEVPKYAALLGIVEDVNADVLATLPPGPRARVERARLEVERHGAIRVGTARELGLLRRMFAIMGMQPVGYYDLAAAGVPVHSTAFRPVDRGSLERNPFRLFTSLLRLELIEDPRLREVAAALLGSREIFTPEALRLTERHEREGGLDEPAAERFVLELLETFRWHAVATVDHDTYRRMHAAHRLVADVVCFKGPHINHLTPRTLDIDAVQAEMPRRGIAAKEIVEGPPPRKVPILLRQTSFKALAETVRFRGGFDQEGAHTARFGEVEQRGIALTPKGRALYDELLGKAQDAAASKDYASRLEQAFADFPDDLDTIREQGLGYFEYSPVPGAGAGSGVRDIEQLLRDGAVRASPMLYEDFLPVSAAGIFQSNLGAAERRTYLRADNRGALEQALGCDIVDEFALYEAQQASSIAQCVAR